MIIKNLLQAHLKIMSISTLRGALARVRSIQPQSDATAAKARSYGSAMPPSAKVAIKKRLTWSGLCLAILSLVVAASTASAQVVVAQSKVSTNLADPILAGVEAPIGVNRKLLVTVSWEGYNQITGISYGSQSLTEAVTAGNGRNASIWYLDAPQFGSHDLEVSFDVPTEARIGALSLQQAASGPPEQINSAVSVLTGDLSSSAYALVLGVYTENGGGALSSNFANTLYSGASGSSVSDAGYQVESVAGVKSYTWSAANYSSVLALVSVAYEPSAVTLDPLAIDAILGQTQGRQEQALVLQEANTFPSSGMWYHENYAISAYWLNTGLATADAGLISCFEDAVEVVNEDESISYKTLYQDRIDVHNFHWHAYLLERIYFLFSAQSTFFPGRMSAEAEAAVLQMLWDWASVDCAIGMADPSTIHFIWGSENHDLQAWVSFWGAAQIFANHPDYQNLTYVDGSTPAEMAAAFDAYFTAFARDRSLKGLVGEVASPTYSKYTLNTWYNLADFANDPDLKAAANALLDIYWADWALEHIDGVRGGSRHRSYSGRSSVQQSGAESQCWFFFGLGQPFGNHPGDMCAMTTFWRPSRATVGLALDREGLGSFQYVSRRLGHKDPNPPAEPPALESGGYNTLNPEGGHLLRKTWCTPDFIMGMSQVDLLPDDNWVAFSSQNRWNGIIFGGHETARIFTHRPYPVDGRSVYNAEWGVQHKGAMLLQRITEHKNAVGQMVWFDYALNREEVGGWIFAEAPRAYAAVRIVDGSWTWVPDSIEFQRTPTTGILGEWAVLNDQYSPVIIEVARKQDYADMAAFQTEILANPLAWDGTRLDYTSTAYATTLTLFADESAAPRVNGTTIDNTPAENYTAPYLQGDFAGGPVMIQYGDERTVHGVAPFADDSETLALWHFDALVSGTDYEDDTSNTGRAALDAVVHVDSTAGITEIADGKFGKGIRCESVAGDQFMMSASGLWPAALGSFRYQGWIRLNAGDTGGYLCHVYDQVYLSVTTSSLTFKINRSGDAQDSSAVNQIELSAMIDGSNDWQYIEAVYDGERMQLVTEVETVSAPGIGLFVPDRRNVYIGSRKNKNNYVGDMDEVKLSAFMPDPVVVAGSAERLQLSNPDLETNTIANFSPAIGEHCKLVVTASWESEEHGIAGVAYAGEPFSEAVSIYGGLQSSIWYLDLDAESPSSGDVVVTFNAPTDSRIGVLSLENAAAGAPAETVADTGETMLSLTAAAHNSLSVGVYTENNDGALSSDFANTLYSGGSGSSVGNSGYQFEPVAGAHSYTWTAANDSPASVVANFAPAPFVVAALPDGDADGIADEWEIEQFGNLSQSSPASNADGDPWTDLEEFIAGTDPWDPDSKFQISATTAESISWQAVQGKTYRVLSTEDLTQEWGVEATGLQGIPPQSSYFFSTEPDQKFFKIEVE